MAGNFRNDSEGKVILKLTLYGYFHSQRKPMRIPDELARLIILTGPKYSTNLFLTWTLILNPM